MNKMNEKVIMDLLKQGNVSIPTILMDNYAQLGLNETEFLTLLHLTRFIEKGNSFPTMEEITHKMAINLEQCSSVLRGLIQKGFLAIEQSESQQLIKEIYSIEPLWERLTFFLLSKELAGEKQEVESLYTIFEKEFGRPLSPIECESLVMWEEQDGHTPLMIKAALKEAVLSGKLNFKYIATILFEWEKKGIKTLEQALQQGRQFRQYQTKTSPTTTQKSEKIPYFDWLGD